MGLGKSGDILWRILRCNGKKLAISSCSVPRSAVHMGFIILIVHSRTSTVGQDRTTEIHGHWHFFVALYLVSLHLPAENIAAFEFLVNALRLDRFQLI